MSGTLVQPIRSRMRVEDLLLGVLGVATVPVLWWLGHSWDSRPAASSGQTLEYWIALIFGFCGIALCVMWVVFFLAGLGLIIGLKTRNAALAYWAEVFTPKFLRRLIISVLGLQVAIAPQAFALPSQHVTSEIGDMEDRQPFMPDVYTPETGTTESKSPTDDLASEEVPTATPHHAPQVSESITAPTTALTSPNTETLSPTVEPRQHSEVTITPAPVASPSFSEGIDPAPRQTSTIEVEHNPVSETQSDRQRQPTRNRFVPQQPMPSPYIAAPQPTRNTEDPTVVIKTGDCLWDIAHQELGAEATLFQIDQRWRQWWEYNRTQIGEDPHVLSPGTVLKAPPFTS